MGFGETRQVSLLHVSLNDYHILEFTDFTSLVTQFLFFFNDPAKQRWKLIPPSPVWPVWTWDNHME